MELYKLLINAWEVDEHNNYVPSFCVSKIEAWGDFPGGPMVENPPPSAGDAGSISRQGTKIPHVTGQLSPCATATEPALSSPHSATREKCAMKTSQNCLKNIQAWILLESLSLMAAMGIC